VAARLAAVRLLDALNAAARPRGKPRAHMACSAPRSQDAPGSAIVAMQHMSDYRSATRPPRREQRARAVPRAERDGDPIATTDGRVLHLRPIRPDDVDALRRGFARLTPEQIRLRVFHRMNELSPRMAALMANVDPDRAAAFVATDAEGEIRGEARIYIDVATDSAEFALIVDPTLTGLGLGRALMLRLIAESRRRGLAEMWGYVLSENASMLDLAARLGAEREPVPGEPNLLRVRLDLTDPRIAAPD
jgi:acetyltransferase